MSERFDEYYDASQSDIERLEKELVSLRQESDARLELLRQMTDKAESLRQELEEARRVIAEAWAELAEVDGHESLSKATSNAIQRRNKELLQYDNLLDKAESENEKLRARLRSLGEVVD